MIGLLTTYFLSIFLIFIIYIIVIPSDTEQRSGIKFIARINITQNKNYWDKYQQPLRHLIGVEIGVYKGDHSQKILNFLNINELVLVDPWKAYMESIYTNNNLNYSDDDSFYERLYQEVKTKFSNNPKVKIIRDFSINASKKFDNEYFDFIYLDGNHSYKEVLKDLNAWYPKLKKFGVFTGDDYGHISGLGVIKAVTEFSYKHKLTIHYGDDNQFWFVKI